MRLVSLMTQSSAPDFDIPGDVHNLKKKKTVEVTLTIFNNEKSWYFNLPLILSAPYVSRGEILIYVSTIEPGIAPSGEEPLLLMGWTLLGSWTRALNGSASTSVNNNTKLYCLLE